MAIQNCENNHELTDFEGIQKKEVFWVAEYKFRVHIEKFKMADPKWRLKFSRLKN